MKPLSRRVTVVAAGVALLAAPLLAVAPAEAADDPVVVNLVGINDFHGRIDSATVQWAGTVKQLEADAPAGNSLLVSAGDNVSASLFASAVQDDNPTIDLLNAVGLDASATGNHEFDKGYNDLVNRIIPRADFPILGANVKKADGSNALDASATFDIQGVKVAIIGAVTQETPSLVSPAGIEGLTFGDPVAGINAEVTRLKALPEAQRPDVMVASYHEGAPDGTQTYAQAAASSAVFEHLAEDTSADVDAIFMGHTHQKYDYDAPIPGQPGKTRPILQTGNYGENVGQIKLTVDPATGDVQSYTKRNLARVTTADAALIQTYPSLAQVKQIRDDAVSYANTVGNVEKGQITGDLTRASTTAGAGTVTEDRAAESNLGNLIADALVATVAKEPAGADLGLVNPGGIRADLRYAPTAGGVDAPGVTTYAELNAVLPFANNLVSVKLTGASLKKIFEQQWQTNADGTVPSRSYLQLGTSKNVSYTFDPTLPAGSRVQSIRINGEPLDPAKEYKVATFSFLSAGGDNFRAFKEGVTTDTGLVDRDGWIKYFGDNSPIDPSYAKHAVQTTGLKKQYRVGSTVSYTLSKLDLTSLGTPATTRVVSKLIYDGGSKTIGTSTVTNGTSAAISTTLPANVSGAMRIESTAYAGSLPVGTKAVVPLDVTGAAITATPGEAVPFGEDASLDVTVSGPEEQPTGTVTVLTQSDEQIGTGTLADGKATIAVDTSKLGAGTSTVKVRYGGDANYLAQTTTADIAVTKVGTSVEATGPADDVRLSDPAPVDVTVTSDSGTTPTGQVTLKLGDQTVGTGTLADAKATIEADLSTAQIGRNTLSVEYAGDDDHESSTGTAEVDVIKGDPGLAATATPGEYGKGAKVTVTGGQATGLVTLYHDGAVVGQGLMKDGTGTITTLGTALQPGSYDLDVLYNGSTSYDPDDTTVAVTITKATTTTASYSISPTRVVKGKAVKIIYEVKADGFVPTGTITVTTGTYKKVVALNSKGRASATITFNLTGAKSVKAVYSGSAVANTSTGAATFTVNSK